MSHYYPHYNPRIGPTPWISRLWSPLPQSSKERQNVGEEFYSDGKSENMTSGLGTMGTPTSPPITTTKERVLAAAAKCGDAARVLKELFPEAFVKPLGSLSGELKIGRYGVASERYIGEFKGKGFWLDSCTHDWIIVIDDKGEQVLVPTPKP